MIWRRITLTLLGLFAIAMCFSLAFLNTSWGARAVISIAESQVPGLKITYDQGTLSNKLRLKSVSFEQNEIQINVDNISIQIQLSCLWRKTLCIDVPDADLINITLADANYIFLDLSFSARWEKDEIKIKHLALRYENLEQILTSITLEGKVKLLAPYPLDVKLDGDIEQAPFWPPLNQTVFSAHIQGDIQRLLFELETTGPLEMQGQGEVQPLQENLPFSLSLTAAKLPLPESYTEQVLPSSLSLQANGDLLRQQIEIEALTFIDPLTQSEASLTGTFNYQQGIAWETSIEVNNFVLPNLLPVRGQFTGKLDSQGLFDGDTWNLVISNSDLSGQLNNFPASLSGDFSLNHLWQMPSSNIHLELNDLIADLQGYTDEEWHVSGTLSANSLQQWHPEFEGKGSLQLDISGVTSDPLITFEGQMNSLAWQQLSLPSLSLSGRYQPERNHQTSINLNSDNLSLNQFIFDNMQITLEGNLAEQNLSLNSSGEIRSNLKLQGNWLAEDKHWQGSLSSNSSIGYSDFDWLLQEDVKLDIDTNATLIKLSAHCWQGQQNSFCLQQEAELGSSGHVDIALNANLAFFDKYILPPQIQLETRLEGELALEWGMGPIPNLEAQFKIDPGQLLYGTQSNLLEVMAWQEGNISVSANSQIANLTFTLQNQSLPLIDIDLNLTNELQKVEGRVQFMGLKLTPFSAFVDEVREIEGVLYGDIAVSGDVVAPITTGQLNISQAKIDLYASPVPVENINIALDFEDQQTNIEGSFYIAEDRGNIQGQAVWKDLFALDLTLNAEQLNIIYPPQLVASIRPNLSLSLQPEKLILEGQIEVLSGALTLEQLPEGSVQPSRDLIFVDDDLVQISKQAQFDIEADINITIDESFELDANGLDGRLKGQVQLVHQQELLQLFGSLSILDGQYSAYGQDLKIERGELSFNGSANNPYLDIRAVREIKKKNIVVGLLIQGQADNPVISFFSDPTMEESETLSYLTRGRGLDAAVGTSAVINLALSAAQVGTSGIFEGIESTSGINNITLNTEGDGDDTQATISGYIGDRLYLEYGVGVYKPINELTVRLYILSRLWLETVSGLENSADLYYSFEID